MNPLKILGLLVAFATPMLSHAHESGSPVLFETDRTVPIVNLALTLRKGAVSDPVGRTGLTNLVGEMLLRGTKFHTKEEFDREMDSMGAEIGVEVRAEALILRGAVLSSKLERFLALLEEAITQQQFQDSELRKLKAELLSGLAELKGRDPKLASELFTRFLFDGHPYGKPILGLERDIRATTRDDIKRHYRRIFDPADLVLIGSGDAEHSKLQNWLAGLQYKLKELKMPEQVTATQLSPPGTPKGRRVLFVDKPERTQTQILIGQGGITFNDPKFFALHTGNFIFGGGGFTSRLMQEIRVKRGWSYGAGSNFRFGTQPRSWTMSLMPKTQDTAPALRESLRLIEELKTKGVSAAEMKLAKASLVNGTAFMGNTPEKRVENAVLETTLSLPPGFMKTWGRELKQVTETAVNDALKSFVAPEDLAILVLGTSTPELLEQVAQAAGVKRQDVRVIQYTDDIAK